MLPLRVLVVIAAGLAGSYHAAEAQSSPAPGPDQSAPTTPPAASPDKSAPAAPPAAPKVSGAGKRGNCRAEAKAKRLKGMDLADSMQLCMAEARVECVKQAIAKKMPIPDRKAFFKTCMQEE